MFQMIPIILLKEGKYQSDGLHLRFGCYAMVSKLIASMNKLQVLFYKKYSLQSDIWSFGCVMYEIWSLGCKPAEDVDIDRVSTVCS